MATRKVLGTPTSSFSPGLLVEGQRLIFISGIVALDAEGNIVGAESMELQAREIFRRMELLLREADASLKDVVKITTFITDMKQYGHFANVRREVFSNVPYPASATVEVSRLVKDGLLIEVEALAVT